MLMRWPRETRAKFAREVGSVALGVLIALAIGEVAEAIRWRVRAHNSLAAIRNELSATRAVMAEWRYVEPCLFTRWRQIDALLVQARQSGNLPDIGPIRRGPSRPVTDA